MLRPCPVIEEAYCGTVGGDGGSEKRLASWRERGVWAVRLRSSQRLELRYGPLATLYFGGLCAVGGVHGCTLVALCVRVSSTEVAVIYL